MSYSEYIIATGGTSGIGLEAAKALAAAKPNALVVITGRTAPQETLPSNIELRKFDLGNLDEIKLFVDGWSHPVAALLLNAGLMTGKLEKIDGIEKVWAVNHLGGAALFFGLRDKGLLAPNARIVFTSSAMHDSEMKGSPHKPYYTTAEEVATAKNPQQQITGVQYSNSKLANVLFAYAISRRAEDSPDTKGWTVIAMDPAFVPGGGSKFNRDNGIIINAITSVISYVPSLVTWASGVVTSTVQRSGQALANLAIGDAHENEKMAYYQLENKLNSSKQSYDVALQDDLWDWTTAKLGVKAKL